jgi:hypothetical protein
MPTTEPIEPKESRKYPPPPPPRKVEHDDDREARERTRVDPYTDENPSICRGMD